jgi:hypothetical protein
MQEAHCRIPGILSANHLMPIGILNAHERFTIGCYMAGTFPLVRCQVINKKQIGILHQ